MLSVNEQRKFIQVESTPAEYPVNTAEMTKKDLEHYVRLRDTVVARFTKHEKNAANPFKQPTDFYINKLFTNKYCPFITFSHSLNQRSGNSAD